ncbi:MAG TPA: hypothetical protein VK616_00900, partial [Flavitalea sp.]|nr:hypothetical protein [Flavitalea sp.]
MYCIAQRPHSADLFDPDVGDQTVPLGPNCVAPFDFQASGPEVYFPYFEYYLHSGSIFLPAHNSAPLLQFSQVRYKD